MLSIMPREKQITGLNMLRQSWKSFNSFMLYAPVGYGKTAIAAFVIAGFRQRNMRCLFIAPYTVILDQTVARFVEYGLDDEEIGYIWRDHPRTDSTLPIQIGSADTLVNRQIPDVDLVIVDEAHIKRRKLLKLIAYWKSKGVKVIGLSGTPFPDFLGHYYETLIKPTSMKELIALGWLSPYEFYSPSHPDLSNVPTSNSVSFGTDYRERELAQAMNQPKLVGDIVQNWLAHGENRQTICFCVNVSHANFIALEFQKAGIAAEIMTAETPEADRKMIISSFEAGITKIIVNVGVLIAGFDSDVRCIIFARPTKSIIRWIQMLGRGLRTADGKTECLIFDHTGTVEELGYPDDIEYECLKALSDGMKAGRSVYIKLPKERIPKACAHCNYMKPPGHFTCPKCGFRALGGNDVNTDRTRTLTPTDKAKQKRLITEQQKQRWWSEIKFYQRQRAAEGKHYKDAWCANVFRKKFGEWPDKKFSNKTLQTSPEVLNFIKYTHIAYAKGVSRANP